MKPYLRLLGLRTRRLFFWPVLGLPFLVPTGSFLAVVSVGHRPAPGPLTETELGEAFWLTAVVAALFAILTVSNLTAFLVHDERRDGRARALRLATIDGRKPVAAHLALASLLSLAGVGLGLAVPGAYCLAAGVSPALLLLGCAAAGAVATISGVMGLWFGYLLPRVVTVIALPLAGVGLSLRFAGVLEGAVEAGRVPLVAFVWLVAAHVLTLALLSPLWRRTSARLW